jgi:hypothetical protein
MKANNCCETFFDEWLLARIDGFVPCGTSVEIFERDGALEYKVAGNGNGCPLGAVSLGTYCTWLDHEPGDPVLLAYRKLIHQYVEGMCVSAELVVALHQYVEGNPLCADAAALFGRLRELADRELAGLE